MKKIVSAFVLIVFVGMLLSQDLLLAIQQGNKYSLAVLNFPPSGATLTASDTRLLSGTVTDEILRTGLFFTMSQDNMERGLQATNLDPTNCGQMSCAIQAARALGVQVVIVGTVAENPEGFVVDAHMIHVSSRAVVRSAREEYFGDLTGLMTRMPALAKKLVGHGNDSTPTTAAPPRVPEPDYDSSYYDSHGGGFKWQYLGIGLLIAGGVGAGIFFAQNGSNDGGNGGGNPPPPPASQLPGPPVFP